MQTGSDLVSAGLPLSNPWTAFLGGSTNVAQGNVPARSNLEWFGLGATLIATSTMLSAASSGASSYVPVPVTPGLVVTNVRILTTATAASVPTHSWAAIYAGTGSAPALISGGQTTDAGSTAVAANSFINWTFATPLTIPATACPYGFVYVALSITATTVPTTVTALGPTTAAWYTPVLTNTASTTAPLFVAATGGSTQGATAAATITSTSAVQQTPIVWLL